MGQEKGADTHPPPTPPLPLFYPPNKKKETINGWGGGEGHERTSFILYIMEEISVDDFVQEKITKREWINMEMPVGEAEKAILYLIVRGYDNVNIRENDNLSFLDFLKLTKSKDMDAYVFETFFADKLRDAVGSVAQNNDRDELLDALVRPSGGDNNNNDDNKKSKNNNAKIKSGGGGGNKKKSQVVVLNKADSLRIANLRGKIDQHMDLIVEFEIVRMLETIIIAACCHDNDKNVLCCKLYLLNYVLSQSAIKHINPHLRAFAEFVIHWAVEKKHSRMQVLADVFALLPQIFEKEDSKYLSTYADRALYDHQRKLFQTFHVSPFFSDEDIVEKRRVAKLVLYIAPTGTGKTMTPVGLCEDYRIIFLCVARHIGLSLAKMAVSVGKRVAFAFGCETASDVRLHNFAAVDYVKDRRSGGIRKVDNSVGFKVQIMICDIQSYLIAMRYMLAFNDAHDIILFWDEPTIGMDYETHPLHAQIAQNWRENRIPKIVLSCATLPREREMADTVQSFREKFDMAEIVEIMNCESIKSVCVLDATSSKAILPHNLFRSYTDLRASLAHCIDKPSLLRYFDLTEMVRCCLELKRVVDQVAAATAPAPASRDWWDENCEIGAYFGASDSARGVLGAISLGSAKRYYLKLLSMLENVADIDDLWPTIFDTLSLGQTMYYQRTVTAAEKDDSRPALKGMLLATKDAWTLTDGPSMFLCENIENVGKFCLAQANIPAHILAELTQRIARNNLRLGEMSKLEKTLSEKEKEREDGGSAGGGGGGGASKSSSSSASKSSRGNTGGREDGGRGGGAGRESREERAGGGGGGGDGMTKDMHILVEKINLFRNEIELCSLDAVFVPNTLEHRARWCGGGGGSNSSCGHSSPFVPQIDADDVREIMNLEIADFPKLLLLMGIGMFGLVGTCASDSFVRYTELMKQMAFDQKLFLVIAHSDYIYGTNYQFCHGFIGKDLMALTQQKIIQAMGRIGRGHLQRHYTVRFRCYNLLRALFLPMTDADNVEARVMRTLLSSATYLE